MKSLNILRKNILEDKVFIDGDVILDLLLKRNHFYKAAVKLFTLIEEAKVIGYTSPLIIADIYYIVTKLENKKSAFEKIRLLRNLLGILELNDKIIDMAIARPYNDFEDSIEYHCAVEHGINILITRNIKDYPKGDIDILEPVDYITMFNRI